MNKLADFIKTTAMGGLLVILPILLLILFLSEIMDAVVALAVPIAGKGLKEMDYAFAVALGVLVVASFIIGLIMRSNAARRFYQWGESCFLERTPGFTALKRLTRGFAGNSEEHAAFKPALLENDVGDRDIIYLIEDHGNGQVTVLVPWAPAAFAGNVKIVDRSRIQMVDANLGDFSNVLAHWGVGARDFIPKVTENK